MGQSVRLPFGGPQIDANHAGTDADPWSPQIVRGWNRARTVSWGRAGTKLPSRPVMSTPATRLLRIASSVASTVASNTAFSRRLSGMNRRLANAVVPGASAASWAVEKARKRSPDV